MNGITSTKSKLPSQAKTPQSQQILVKPTAIPGSKPAEGADLFFRP